MDDRVYFVVSKLHSRKYEVCSGSKYWNKSKTGTDRYKTKDEADEACSKRNELNITGWNPY